MDSIINQFKGRVRGMSEAIAEVQGKNKNMDNTF